MEAILRKVCQEGRPEEAEKVGETEGPLNASGSELPMKQPLKRKLEFKAQERGGQVPGAPPKQGDELLFFKEDTPVYLDGGDLPWYFPVSFRPPSGVRFVIVELAVGAYIFDNVLEKR
ncbi:hypothetical protein PIB30_090922 [Stylosanthes scabra]|uniref:Uncharacterized protein n=1 Tax=Stylosanthes scabra TaxID=79078 RepID=A0ABU6RVS6_9FABA|nr:hypothetical protein [Stylosanthes scabra]